MALHLFDFGALAGTFAMWEVVRRGAKLVFTADAGQARDDLGEFVSLAHSIVAVCGAAFAASGGVYGASSSLAQWLVLVMSAGYFANDLFHTRSGSAMQFHHVTVTLGCLAGLAAGGTECCVALAVGESSSVVLHARHFVAADSQPYDLLSALFAFVFVGVRLLYCSYFVYCVLTAAAVATHVKVLCMAVFAVNLFFGLQIAVKVPAYAARLLRPRRRHERKAA